MFYYPLVDLVSDDPSLGFAVSLSEQHSLAVNRSIIPGTQLQWVWDSTSIKMMQGCLRRYNFRFLQGWTEQETPIALAFGRDFHTCMETYHKCRAYGLDFETSVKRMARLAALLGERLQSLDTSRTKETLVRSVVWYLDEYKDDPLVTAMLPDGKPAVELSFMLPIFDIKVRPTEELPPLFLSDLENWWILINGRRPTVEEIIHSVSQGRRLFGTLIGIGDHSEQAWEAFYESFYTITIHFSGHIDRVVHFKDEVFVTDYKSSKYQLTLDWVRGFDMSTQFEGYYTAAHILASQPNSVFPSPPAGVLVDALQLGVNFTRFARFPLRYSASVADDFLSNLEALVRIKAETSARLGLWPREAESECNAYRRADGSGGCEFRPVCLAPPAARERELQQRFTRSIWDPSKSR